MDIQIKYDSNNNLILEKKSKLLLVLSLVITITLLVYTLALNYYIENNGKFVEYIAISIVPVVVILLSWYYYRWSSGSKKIVFDVVSKTIFYNGKPLAYFKHVKSVSTRSDTENELYKVIILFSNNKEIVVARTKQVNAANNLLNKIQSIIK